MHIRLAKLSDAPALAYIGKETFALACPPGTTQQDIDAYIQSELIISKFEAHINSPSKAIFSAKAAEGVVGYMMLAWEDVPAEVKGVKPLELKRIYVLQKYHGSGIAQALMTEAKSFAGRQDNDVMWLGVSKQNPRGIAFYSKQGFEVVGEQRFTVGQDIHEDLIMASSLVSHFTSQLS